MALPEPADLSFAPGPEDRAVEREGLERLMRCMRGLSEVQRKSVLLAYYEGYSHTELAQVMGAPLGTVKAWIRRGLSRRWRLRAKQISANNQDRGHQAE